MKRTLGILGFLIIACGTVLRSEEDGAPLAVATYRTIFSAILDEEREVSVSLPYDYHASSRRYPVLYILDGEEPELASFIGVARFYGYHRIPEMIIVGIPNTNRNRDLFASSIEGLADTEDGSAWRFLRFLSDELIPFIDRSFRTTTHRTVYGQSAGGQFAVFALLTDPNVFDCYLASSPVIGYSRPVLLEKAGKFFAERQELHKSLYVYYGTTDYSSVVDLIPQLESIIQTNRPNGFRWRFEGVEGRHVPWNSFRELILMPYTDWVPVRRPTIVPVQGELRAGETAMVELEEGPYPLYYTLDGEEPSLRSHVYRGPFTVTAPSTVKAKTVNGNLQESSTVEAVFQLVERPRPSRDKGDLHHGLRFRYAEQQMFGVPHGIRGEAKKTGVVSSVDLGIRDRDQVYVVEYEGYVKVPKDGRYRLILRSTSAKLVVDGEEIIARGGLVAREVARDLSLQSGYHDLRLVTSTFLQLEHQLELSWEGPGIERQVIPPAAFFYE